MPTRLILEEREGNIQVFLDREGQIRPEAAGPPVSFEPPLTPEEREDLRWYLEDYLEAPYAVYQDRGSAIADLIPVWGERLFAAIFGPGKPEKLEIARERESSPFP